MALITYLSRIQFDFGAVRLLGEELAALGVRRPLTRYAEPLVKDTVDVEPHMGSVVIEFTAHNPGDWFLHCHKPMHMEGGMIILARIA